MDTLKAFEEKVDIFCANSNISRSDPLLWNVLLSEGFIGGYMPAEFIWKYRYQIWNWPIIIQKYKIGQFLHMYRDKSMSYKDLLNLWHKQQMCECVEWLH